MTNRLVKGFLIEAILPTCLSHRTAGFGERLYVLIYDLKRQQGRSVNNDRSFVNPATHSITGRPIPTLRRRLQIGRLKEKARIMSFFSDTKHELYIVYG